MRSVHSSASVPLDQELYDRIVADMRDSAGVLAPAGIWQPEALFPGLWPSM